VAKPLIQWLSEQTGACCQFGFMNQPQYKKLSNRDLGATLGVSERTVCETRSMINNGGIQCRHKTICALKKSS
jgi:hypothetical protein